MAGDETWRDRARGALQRGERWLVDFIAWALPGLLGLYGSVGLFLTAGLAVAAAATWGFASLAESVMEGETATFDRTVLLWLNRRATPWLDIAALEITALGSGPVVAVLVLVASALLWSTRHRSSVLLLWLAVLGSTVLNQVLKLAFPRPRPRIIEWRAHYAGPLAFPSGHALISMVVYVILAYVIVRLRPPPSVRRSTLGLAATIIVLVGLSRLYLGVHYPSDVIAGYTAGLAWAAFCVLTVRLVMHFRR